ncbi:TOPRIM domain protein [Methanocorpusculum labreanum Z]|uniref:DNA primase DnaG n=1 Tax=Methanocorpusculum labreanum (strain ATCC 43576 / DSM 4855 / Z) TaxID=410358 RepID=DNAG_METLZ|nr:DNA primase DnaG [Methanocorpusculum labreanum]A2SQD1.1 RecName: Full=DNA primase DnaG [Methanocorpusculum labreanum Z]ABN06537.1 TOPRIM domain protein [Methanocorpusculum labreanum Z]
MYSIDSIKYLIHIHIEAEGVVEKTDVVGAIFGQTEGLLGEELDLRDLQRSGRIGRIDVQIVSKHGKTAGECYIASSLDRAETAILAAALETIDRIGPCMAAIRIQNIEDLRAIKRRQIVERAKELLLESFDEVGISTYDILTEVREASRVEKITTIGPERLPAGPAVLESDAIIIVEGRADVLNLLKCGINNTVAVEGTKVPETVIDLSAKKNTTVFVDGDRGGDLILRELLQVADIDFVAFSPRRRSVEDMSRKEIVKSLRNKVPASVLKSHIEKDEPISDLVFEIEAGEEEHSSVSQKEEGNNTTPDVPADLPEEPPKSNIDEAIIPPITTSEQNLVKPENPHTIQEHTQYMKNTGRSRVLAEDAGVIGDYSLQELKAILPKLNDDVAGVIVDAAVDQKFIDQAFAKGLTYVAANAFEGIVRRPAGLRLIPF